YLLHVGTDRLADGSHRIDKRDLHCQKCVGGVLDELSALGAGHNQRRRNARVIGLWDGILALVIRSACERLVNLAKQAGAAVMISAQHNAIGIQKIGDRGTFAQELWIGSDVEGIGCGAVAQHDGTDPIAGIYWHRTLLDYAYVEVDLAGVFSSLLCDIIKE